MKDKQVRVMARSSSNIHATHYYNFITDFKQANKTVKSQMYIKLSCFDPKCHAQVPDRL